MLFHKAALWSAEDADGKKVMDFCVSGMRHQFAYFPPG